jgi:hypothetical protein
MLEWPHMSKNHFTIDQALDIATGWASHNGIAITSIDILWRFKTTRGSFIYRNELPTDEGWELELIKQDGARIGLRVYEAVEWENVSPDFSVVEAFEFDEDDHQ